MSTLPPRTANASRPAPPPYVAEPAVAKLVTTPRARAAAITMPRILMASPSVEWSTEGECGGSTPGRLAVDGRSPTCRVVAPPRKEALPVDRGQRPAHHSA